MSITDHAEPLSHLISTGTIIGMDGNGGEEVSVQLMTTNNRKEL